MPIRMGKIEVTFLQDHRMLAMNPSERIAYLALWLLAVEQRTSTLPASAAAPPYVSRRAGVAPRHVSAMLTQAASFTPPLITIESDGGVTLCGISKLHTNLFRSSDEPTSLVYTRHNKTPPVHNKSKDQVVAQEPVRMKSGEAVVVAAYEAATGRSIRQAEKAQLQAVIIKSGKDRALYGIQEAVTHDAVSLAYIKKVAASDGDPKQEGLSLADEAKQRYG